MFGKKLGLLLLATVVSGCGAQKYEDEVTRRRLIAWIDDRQYQRVVSFINFEATESEKIKLAPIEAQAYMGMGGFEMLAVMEAVKGEMNYSRSAFEEMSRGCPQGALKAKQFKKIEVRCMMVRLFNALPQFDREELIKARDLWRKTVAQRGPLLSQQDQILATTFEASLIVSRVGKILADFDDMSRNEMKAIQVDQIFADIKIVAEDAKEWIETSYATAKSLNDRFSVKCENGIFNASNTSRLEFVRNTGIPKLIAISDMNNQDVEARMLRANVIRELDSILVKFFKVK